jgi:hypothetical protein
LPEYTDPEAGRYEALWVQLLKLYCLPSSEVCILLYSLEWYDDSWKWMRDGHWEETLCDHIATAEEYFMVAEEIFITLSDINSAHLWSKGPLRIPKSTWENFDEDYIWMIAEVQTEVEYEESDIRSILRGEDGRSRVLEEGLDVLLCHLRYRKQYWAVD